MTRGPKPAILTEEQEKLIIVMRSFGLGSRRISRRLKELGLYRSHTTIEKHIKEVMNKPQKNNV